MKTKLLPITLLISALLHTPIAIQAQTQFESDGIMYEVTDAQQKTVKVIENTTHPYEQQGSKDYVLVPQVAYDNTTYSVTEIDKNAFYNCGITSIVIPEGINKLNTDNKTERYIYDLQGRRVDKPEKGIYIIDGKPHICP